MAALPAIINLFLFFSVLQGSKLTGEDKNQIIWPTEYHLRGEKLNLKSSVIKPYEIWYNEELKRFRIDLYGGTDKKYYYGDINTVYTIVPESTETYLNKMKCYKKIQLTRQNHLLPDTENFNYTGKTEYLFDKEVDVWSSKARHHDTVREKTLYVYRTDEGYDLPVQYILKAYDRKRGIVKAHFIYKYYNFEATATKDDLTIENSDVSNCDSMGTIGDNWKTDQKFLHPDIPGDVETAFKSYANHHKKNYHEHEILMRKSIFENNWRMVEEHNRKNQSYKMEVNAFSDKTLKELNNLKGSFGSEDSFPLLQAFPHSSQEIDELVQELPTNFDLRMEGVIGPVRDQGNCGACWAFTTTAVVEIALTRSNGGRLLDLSEQSIIDCAWGSSNSGCNGGLLPDGLKFVIEHGIPTEEDYGTYNDEDGYCHIANVSNTYKIKGFVKVPPRSKKALKLAVYKYGAVGVSMRVSRHFTQYSTGVIFDTQCDRLRRHPKKFRPLGRHAVVVVGYGVRDGEEYWIVRNCWGQDWGQGGYFLLSAKHNNCFLMDRPFYPIV